VRMLSAQCSSPMERIVDMLPQALEKLGAMGGEDDEKLRPAARVRAAYQE